MQKASETAGACWRNAPLRSASAEDAEAISPCCKVFWGLRSGDEPCLGMLNPQSTSEHERLNFTAEESFLPSSEAGA